MNPITKAYMINNGQYTYSWFMYDLSTSLTYMLFLQVDFFFCEYVYGKLCQKAKDVLCEWWKIPNPPTKGFYVHESKTGSNLDQK